ncbi:MAG: hypothetical protein AAB619_03955 [Patescibacteria group bacterium]
MIHLSRYHRWRLRQLGLTARSGSPDKCSGADLDRVLPRHFPLSLTSETSDPPAGADAPHTNQELNVIISGSAGGILPPRLRQK